MIRPTRVTQAPESAAPMGTTLTSSIHTGSCFKFRRHPRAFGWAESGGPLHRVASVASAEAVVVSVALTQSTFGAGGLLPLLGDGMSLFMGFEHFVDGAEKCGSDEGLGEVDSVEFSAGGDVVWSHSAAEKNGWEVRSAGLVA